MAMVEIWRGPDDGDAVQASLLAQGVTDGLPVVPPTRPRVDAMLAPHGVPASKVVTKVAPGYETATWESVAINAVMAGCAPEHLPIVVAAIEAMAAPAFNLQGIATTTGNACPLVLVSGPGAETIGMNAGGNALGPGNRANATIGRAVSLVLRNVGGAEPGVFDMATLGWPAKYTCCLAENERESPWPSLAVERGFAASQTVVTVAGIAGFVEIVDSTSQKGADLAQTFAHSMLIAGYRGMSGLIGGGEPLLIIPPEIAALFAQDGYAKEDVKAAIHERAQLPLDRLAAPVRDHLIATGNAEPGKPLRLAHKASDVMIVVAGGIGIKALHAPNWAGGTRATSRAVPG